MSLRAPHLSAVPGSPAPSPSGRGPILGQSPAVVGLRAAIDLIAVGEAPVLITGESGSGKELVAREIHARSRRAGHPFVAVNCAALPASLLDSELFGHVRGAFTDAKRSHEGLFAQAGRGTIFLDEIGEMPLEMQAKLLRVVERRAVRPIGSGAEIAVGARLLTATNRDLDAEVAAGRFRHDLYYRINVVDVTVPPLRHRVEDIVHLARHFASSYARLAGREVPALSARAIRCLVDHPWPGNVRELENCMQRAVTLARTSVIDLEDLPPRVREHGTRSSTTPGLTPRRGGRSPSLEPAGMLSLYEVQRRHIEEVLTALKGNRSRAARALGIDRRTFYRWIERLNVSSGRGARDPAATDDPAREAHRNVATEKGAPSCNAEI